MTQQTQPSETHVFLEGDGNPVPTALSVEQVAAAVYDAEEAGARWVRVPMSDGRDALMRPQYLVAIIPAPLEEEC